MIENNDINFKLYNAEVALLAALIGNPESMDTVELDRRDFHGTENGLIFEGLQRLNSSGTPINLTTAVNSAERLGGNSEAVRTVIESGRAEYPDATVEESLAHFLAMRENVRLANAARVLERLAGDDLPAEEKKAKAEEELAKAFDGVNYNSDVRTLSEAMFESLKETNDARNGSKPCFPCGLSEVDDGLNGGLYPGKMIVVAGVPGAGKSVLAIQSAINVALAGGTSLLFSMEMSDKEIAKRVIAAKTGISVSRQMLGKVNEYELDAMANAVRELDGFNMFIEDASSLTPAKMRAVCSRTKRRHGLDLVVVDYLQLMNGNWRYNGNRVAEVGDISREIKKLAGELGVPMIAVSQLSRALETRADRRPMLSDLRDSGQVGQDADAVLMLYREGVYDERADQSKTECIFRKNRNGSLGTVNLVFNGEKMSFGAGVAYKPKTQAKGSKRVSGDLLAEFTRKMDLDGMEETIPY